VGCASKRAVSDVSADADPYSGLAVHYTSPQCKSSYEEPKGVKHVLKGWCTIGGTSLASPLIASVFALAGGAGGVQYPARTLYERAAKSPAALHDSVSGSNGECAKGFNEEGVASCTAAEEAAASCASQLICLAASGYDGPTGVGTPNGILAFQPTLGEETSAPPKTETPPGSGTTTAAPAPAAGPPPPPAPAAPASVRISRLALTSKARVALNRGHARLSQVGFGFSINLPARVRASLAKGVRTHGHLRWRALRAAATFNVPGGYHDRRLAGRTRLPGGVYRLTLSPASGAGRAVLFHVR
jgi:hypothetical protein